MPPVFHSTWPVCRSISAQPMVWKKCTDKAFLNANSRDNSARQRHRSIWQLTIGHRVDSLLQLAIIHRTLQHIQHHMQLQTPEVLTLRTFSNISLRGPSCSVDLAGHVLENEIVLPGKRAGRSDRTNMPCIHRFTSSYSVLQVWAKTRERSLAGPSSKFISLGSRRANLRQHEIANVRATLVISNLLRMNRRSTIALHFKADETSPPDPRRGARSSKPQCLAKRSRA